MRRLAVSHIQIYRTRWHLIATLFFIIIPFVFLLIFSQIAKVTSAQLFSDVFVSLSRLILAYVISVILAWIFAVSFYRGRRALIALPIFDVLQSFPTFAALPLATLVWGATNFTVIFFLVITIIWPVFFSIISSLKLIRRDWEEAVQISQLSGIPYLKDFLWPLTIPGLITGSLIGLGEGWGALVATEIIVGIKSGLGNFFQDFSHNTTITTLGILGLLIIVFSVNKLVWTPLLNWSHRLMGE